MRHTAKGLMAAGLLAGMAAFAPAQAVPFSFNFTFGGGNDQTYSPSGPGTLLADAVTVTEGVKQFILTTQSVSGPPAGAVGDSVDYVAAPFAVPLAPSGVLPAVLNISWTAGLYEFSSVSGTYLRDSVNNALNFRWLGFFTDTSGVLDTQGATYTQTWSQAVAGIQPSTSGTFNTNPDIIVRMPEAMTLLMFGAGLIGLGLFGNRRRVKGSRPTALLA
jgi:hypothetical protein